MDPYVTVSNSKPLNWFYTGVGMTTFGYLMDKTFKVRSFLTNSLDDLLHSDTARAAVDTANTANPTLGDGLSTVFNAAAYTASGFLIVYSIAFFDNLMTKAGEAPSKQVIKHIQKNRQAAAAHE